MSHPSDVGGWCRFALILRSTHGQLRSHRGDHIRRESARQPWDQRRPEPCCHAGPDRIACDRSPGAARLPGARACGFGWSCRCCSGLQDLDDCRGIRRTSDERADIGDAQAPGEFARPCLNQGLAARSHRPVLKRSGPYRSVILMRAGAQPLVDARAIIGLASRSHARAGMISSAMRETLSAAWVSVRPLPGLVSIMTPSMSSVSRHSPNISTSWEDEPTAA